jgi:hypothetical protein
MQFPRSLDTCHKRLLDSQPRLYHSSMLGELGLKLNMVLRYTHGLGCRMHCCAEVTESSTNKQHHLSLHSLHSRQ